MLRRQTRFTFYSTRIRRVLLSRAHMKRPEEATSMDSVLTIHVDKFAGFELVA